jgi:hypothetical protein
MDKKKTEKELVRYVYDARRMQTYLAVSLTAYFEDDTERPIANDINLVVLFKPFVTIRRHYGLPKSKRRST